MYSQYPRVVDLIISALLAAALGLTIWAPTFARDNAIKVVAAVSGGSFSPVFDIGTSVAAAAAFSLLLCTISNVVDSGVAHVKETEKTFWIKAGLVSFAVVFLFAALVPATFIVLTGSGEVSSSARSGPRFADVHCSLLSRNGIVEPGGRAESDALLLSLIEVVGGALANYSDPRLITYVVIGWAAFLSAAIDLVLIILIFRDNKKNGIYNGLGVIVGLHEIAGDVEKYAGAVRD